MKNKIQNTQSGFTLVEMGIVVVIIALLIGGVLKGREVLSDAQLTGVVATIKSIDMATKAFVDLYSYLPGDIPNPPTAAAVVPNCAAAPCAANGNGDFMIEATSLGTVPAGEGYVAFLNLAAAGLFSGISSSGAMTFGAGLPKAAVGGGFWLGSSNGTTASQTAGTVPAGNYVVLNGTVATVGAATGRLTAEQAAQIDIKMDDGVANGGTVRGAGAAACMNGAAYERSDIAKQCTIYARILN